MQNIQTQLSKKQKVFAESVAAFPKCTSNFEHFQKKITFIVYLYPKLRTVKNVVR